MKSVLDFRIPVSPKYQERLKKQNQNQNPKSKKKKNPTTKQNKTK